MDYFLLSTQIFDYVAEISHPSRQIQASIRAGHILWNNHDSKRYLKLLALKYKR